MTVGRHPGQFLLLLMLLLLLPLVLLLLLLFTVNSSIGLCVLLYCPLCCDDWLCLLIQDEDQVDYSKIEPSADFFAPPRGTALYCL